ncbi:MAG: M48 family metallopeptidase [Planctomycetota bacterium]
MRSPHRAWLLGSLLTASCGSVNLYSDADLEPISLEAYAEATAGYPLVDSGPEHDQVQEVTRRITAVTGVDFPWEARLLRADEVPNAFCLPNGRIAVYTGILPITQNIDGLAAVIGHEVAHATRRHGGVRMTQKVLGGFALALAEAGLELSEMDREERALTMAALGGVTQYGVLLPYSRQHETEADLDGVRFAIRAGFDPWEAPKLWERMAALGSSGPEFLSTHPDPRKRAARLRAVIPQLLAEERARGAARDD